jgi:hypothetical protein
VTYSEVIWLGYKGERFTVEFGQKSEEIFAGEGPLKLKGRGAALIVGLEGKQTLLEFGQRREIVGGENFSLNDREIDFDLIQPTGVDRGVDQNGVRPFSAETVGRLRPAMSGTIVQDPEDAMGGFHGSPEIREGQRGIEPYPGRHHPKLELGFGFDLSIFERKELDQIFSRCFKAVGHIVEHLRPETAVFAPVCLSKGFERGCDRTRRLRLPSFGVGPDRLAVSGIDALHSLLCIHPLSTDPVVCEHFGALIFVPLSFGHFPSDMFGRR